LVLGGPTLHVEDMIGGDAVEPGAKLAFAFERAEPGEDFDEHFLRHLFGVLWMEDHADSDVVNPCLMPQDKLFQGGSTAFFCLFH
jgi:hypothetical protein